MRPSPASPGLGSALALALLSALFLGTTAVASDRSLILVPTPPPSMLGELLAEEILVVQNGESYLLVVGNGTEIDRIERLGGVAQVLDTNTEGRSYYTVISRGAPARTELGAPRVLYEVPAAPAEADTPLPGPDALRATIVEATPEEAAALSATGAEIARIFLRPVRLSPQQRRELRSGDADLSTSPEGQSLTRRDGIDPWIQSQVELIEGANIDATVQRLQDFGTRYAAHDSCFAAADWIAETLRSYGIEDVSLQSFDSQLGPNVVAMIPGQGTPQEQIVIGGHYDSYTSNHNNCPGADDNASGTSGVLECARILSQGVYDRTIVIIAYGGEEFGLLGSEAYAQLAAMRGDDIIASLAVDMIGYVAGGDIRDLDIIANASSEWLRTLVIDTAAEYVPETPSVPGTIPGGASSDHYSFWQAGYDAVLFFEDSGSYSPYIHTSSDVVGVSYNNPRLALDSVRILTAVTATLARPFELAIEHEPLPNTEESQADYRVEATIRGAWELDLDSLFVQVSTDEDDFTLSLEPTAEPDVFEAWIPAQPPGTFVTYYLEATDTEGHHQTDPRDAPTTVHRFFVGVRDLVFTDDFESDLGWTAGAPGDNATTGIWTRVDPNGTWSGDIPVQPEDDHTVAPGVRCFVTGNASPGGAQGDEDVDGGRTTLLSPRIDLTDATAAWVRYHRWYTNDTGSSPGGDEWKVDISNDDGTVWEPLEVTNESLHDWAAVEVEISALLPLTADMRLRFIATDDEPGSIVEAAVDDLEIRAFFEDSSQVEPGSDWPSPPSLAIQSCKPNPFTDQVEIRFSVPSDGRNATLAVYDTAGRRMAVLGGPVLRPGIQVVRWRAEDDSGNPLPSGIYFLRLSDGRQSQVDRILRIR